jgi:hypothetical protein
VKKAYILVYSDVLGDRDLVKSWASASEVVHTWRFDLPNCFYLISEHTAQEIANDLHTSLGTGRFIIAELNDNRHGWLPSDTWYFLRHKKSKPK